MESGGIFTVPIEFYLGRIPFIITDLITQLDKIQGQNSKSLFNRDFTDERLQILISELKTKRISNWLMFNNPAILSVTLSSYINSLFREEPLITEDIQEILLSIQFTDSPSYLKLLGKIFFKLYSGRFFTFAYLMNFLSRACYISEDRLFNLFSTPFFGQKSVKLNQKFLKELFQMLLRNYNTIFQGTYSKEEAFLTDDEIDQLILKFHLGETVNSKHINGNLTPEIISQQELQRIIDDDSDDEYNIKQTFNQNKLNMVKINGNMDMRHNFPILSNFASCDSITQTENRNINSKLSLTNNMIIFNFDPKNEMLIDKSLSLAENNKLKYKSITITDKDEGSCLRINQPLIIETGRRMLNLQQSNNNNYSFNDDYSSSKINSQTVSSSATSSTTSSYSFNSYAQTSKENIPQIYIENISENKNNKYNKTKKNKKTRNIKDKSDTSDYVSYSDNVINNNATIIPKPPFIPEYLNSNHHRNNYATNHNYNNNYFYDDNLNEYKDNDKSDSQNGSEIKFDFYKNLVNSNTNEVLPPAPMLDPELLRSPIFGNDSIINQSFNQEDDLLFEKNELPPPPSLDHITDLLGPTDNSADDRHISFQFPNELNNNNYNENNDESSTTNNNKSNADEDDSSIASSYKREEEEKKEEIYDEIKKNKDDKEKKNFHLFKYWKRKNEKKKKDDKKTKKEKTSDESKSKEDKKEKKPKKKKSS